jgi:hypothetical protein
VIQPGARGGYFARRTREIYFGVPTAATGATPAGRGAGALKAVHVDTRQVRDVPHARGLVNADETLSVAKNAQAADRDGKYPRPPKRPVVPQLQRMFPGKRLEDLTPDQQYAVAKELRPGKRRGRAERARDAGQEVGGVHRSIRRRPAARLRGRHRQGEVR